MNLVDDRPRRAGSLTFGPLAYGTWRLAGETASHRDQLLHTAVELGMQLVDCADVYGLDWGGPGFGAAEQAIGDTLDRSPGLRDQMVLATKGGIDPGVPYDLSEPSLRGACEASLRRLRTDVIDLYQLHRPDVFTHPEAIARTLTALRDEGKIREVGVSNHSVGQTDALTAFLPFPLATTQPEFSLRTLDPIWDGTLDHAMRTGLCPLAWSPLGGGSLATGTGSRRELIEALDELAAREQVERAQVALAFLIAHPAGAVPIVGTSDVARLRALRTTLSVHLDRADCYRLVEAAEGRSLP